MTGARAAGLASTALLHLAVLLAWAWVRPTPAPTHQGPATIAVQLLQAPAVARQAAPVVAARPQWAPAAPTILLAPPTWLSADAAAPPKHPHETNSGSGSQTSLAPGLPTLPQADAALHAASPPDRACTERQIARHYPLMLRERGIEGQVLLRVRVDAQGRATEIVVQGGSGWRLLDDAARLLTQACSFTPARRGEQALASWVEYPVHFTLSAL